MNHYSNTLRTEANFIKSFRKSFGRPQDVLVGYGNWSGNFHFKGKDPAPKGKRIRKLLRRAGYKVFLVDEYMTSKCCSNCGGENKKFLDISGRERKKRNEECSKNDANLLVDRYCFFFSHLKGPRRHSYHQEQSI